jgi:hypothetical protein
MPSSLWKDDKRKNAQELIDWLISEKTPNIISFSVTNMIAVAELACSSSSTELSTRDIWHILDKMISLSRLTINDFEEIYGEYIQEKNIEIRKNEKIWRFFFPLQLSSDSKTVIRSKIKFIGQDFLIRSIKYVEKSLGGKNVINPDSISDLVGEGVRNIPPVFLISSSKGDTWLKAWERIGPAFDTMRGLLELSLGRGGWRLTNHHHPRRQIAHPLWMIIQGEDKSLLGANFQTEDKGEETYLKLSRGQFDVIKQNAIIIQKEPEDGSTLSTIVDCLRIYSQAMDAHFDYACFLGLWQLAEAIAISETVGGDTGKVAGRISWHSERIGLKSSGYKYILSSFGKKRNDIVHRGIHDINIEEVNILKIICEKALMWLINEHKNLPTKQHLNEFYNLRDSNQAKLSALNDSINYIKQNRTKK